MAPCIYTMLVAGMLVASCQLVHGQQDLCQQLLSPGTTCEMSSAKVDWVKSKLGPYYDYYLTISGSTSGMFTMVEWWKVPRDQAPPIASRCHETSTRTGQCFGSTARYLAECTGDWDRCGTCHSGTGVMSLSQGSAGNQVVLSENGSLAYVCTVGSGSAAAGQASVLVTMIVGVVMAVQLVVAAI